MITVQFLQGKQWRLGVKTEQGIVDVAAAMKQSGEQDARIPDSAHALVTGGAQAMEGLQSLLQSIGKEALAACTLQEETLQFGPCITHPQKIVCVGLNYKRHAEESGMNPPGEPLLFSKFANTLAGHKQTITIPAEAKQMDYEAELAIVIGQTVSNVAKEDALSYVYGYCTANDVSARDLQFVSSQWLLGKTCDGFCPVGPYLVSKDNIADPNRLAITTLVNGEIRQNSNTSDMIFYCDEIISYISKYMTLYPGDLILTGTPEGVVFGQKEGEQVWLKDGDEVVVEIEGVGRLENRFEMAK
ncbi:fumarylacetoacetate hydrolase family protein [Aneurinibacillus sp. REN35]|uniref:fumarylacetoacetate hydrolase family protein n=1 Tax=Aneurinibacillus sp. REN35 TaxID=3237286 RepID=UPI003529857D